MNLLSFHDLNHSCNKYCDLIGQEKVCILIKTCKNLAWSKRPSLVVSLHTKNGDSNCSLAALSKQQYPSICG